VAAGRADQQHALGGPEVGPRARRAWHGGGGITRPVRRPGAAAGCAPHRAQDLDMRAAAAQVARQLAPDRAVGRGSRASRAAAIIMPFRQ
jgi:hypothetical protein